MAVASSALAYKRMALMSATKVTVKPPSEEVLRARDDFQAFCKFMGKAPAKAYAGVAHRVMHWRR